MSRASWNGELLGDEPFLVLNAIYLRKMAPPEHVAQVTSLGAERARALLAEAESEGLTIDVGGQWMLADPGRERVLAYYRETYAAVRDGVTLQEWYRRFETVNAQFIKLVTEWQKSGGDDRVQERLARVVERQATSLTQLSSVIPRYEGYAARFASGLARVDSGERDYVCKPTIDSIHNVWFEFHEDILAVMGKPRET